MEETGGMQPVRLLGVELIGVNQETGLKLLLTAGVIALVWIAVRLLRLAEAMGLNRPLPFLAELLRHSEQPEVIAACLRILQDPGCLDLVRSHASHPDWIVRVQVANALRRLGGREDLPCLLQLLGAPEWWVRYRAAQAIVDAPYLQADEPRRLQAAHTDRYARDILQQVMAERSYL